MRACSRCGHPNPDGGLGCRECGQPFPELRTGLARAALVLGAASFPLLCALGLGGLTAPLAVLLGGLALLRARRSPAEYGGRRQALAGIALGVACLALVTLVTLPALLASRIRTNESTTIADLRAILQAEVAYADANDGQYDTLECVADPAGCLRGHAAPAASLDPVLGALRPRWGYARTFHPGPASAPRGFSPSSLTGFAVVAVPVSPDATGHRSFCVDGSGRLCSTEGGAPTPVAGACPPAPACRELP